MSILIKKVESYCDEDFVADIFIEGETVSAIGKSLPRMPTL